MAQLNNNRLVAREVPTGWPVGSFTTYQEAQEAVDTLSDKEFPVEKLTIVGVDLMQVESITGRLTWGKVLGEVRCRACGWACSSALFFLVRRRRRLGHLRLMRSDGRCVRRDLRRDRLRLYGWQARLCLCDQYRCTPIRCAVRA